MTGTVTTAAHPASNEPTLISNTSEFSMALAAS